MSTSALVITGAAARISQETALIENLLYNNVNFKLENVQFISGASSGALNAVVFNAIINASPDRGKEILEWYKNDVLFPLKTLDVFKFETYNLPGHPISLQLVPIDTSPLRKTLEQRIQGGLNYHKIKDLPINTSLSAVLPSIIPSIQPVPLTRRITNTEDKFDNFYLTDVLMASTAIPFIFPMQIIRRCQLLNAPLFKYIDGGTLNDRVPYMGFVDWVDKDKERRKVDNLYIVTRQRPEKDLEDIVECVKNDLSLLHSEIHKSDKNEIYHKLTEQTEEDGFWDNLLELFKPYSFKTRLKKLSDKYSYVADNIYVFQPDLDKRYPFINFNEQEQQYNATKTWCETNNPIPLDDFLNSLGDKDMF